MTQNRTEQRIQQIENKLLAMNNTIESTDRNLSSRIYPLERTINSFDSRFVNIESNLNELKLVINSFQENSDNLRIKIEMIKKQISKNNNESYVTKTVQNFLILSNSH